MSRGSKLMCYFAGFLNQPAPVGEDLEIHSRYPFPAGPEPEMPRMDGCYFNVHMTSTATPCASLSWYLTCKSLWAGTAAPIKEEL